MIHSPKSASRSARVIVLCVVAAVALLANTGADLWHHHDSPKSAPCQICHTVHLSVVAVTTIAQLPVPVLGSWTAPSSVPITVCVSITRQSPPRAPPASA